MQTNPFQKWVCLPGYLFLEIPTTSLELESGLLDCSFKATWGDEAKENWLEIKRVEVAKGKQGNPLML